MREQLGQLSWDLYYSLTVVSFYVNNWSGEPAQADLESLRGGHLS